MPLLADDPTGILDDLKRMDKPFNFTRDDLGARTCRVAAQAIMVTMKAECDSDSVRWPALSPAYAAEKQLIAPGAPIGVLFGHMRQMDQLEGDQRITINVVEQEYGIDEKAKQEAAEFQEGGKLTGTSQPERPFYYLGIHARSELNEHFDDEWKKRR